MFLPSKPHARSRELDGRLFDLSLTGMRMLADTVQSDGLHIFHPTFSTFEQCLLTIEIETEKGPITLSGQVVWYDKANEESTFSFQIGIKFIELRPEDAKKIQDLCKHLQHVS
jgi:c-di-GMP-binding flagellar brake protein YcgR